MAIDDIYTTLLLHAEGSEGSTIITDENGNQMTANGGPKISTARSKFGSASIAFNGSGYILSPSSDDFYFGLADFTVDMWIYVNSWGGDAVLFANSSSGGFQFGRNGGSNFWGSCIWGIAWQITASPLPGINGWHHVAAVRESGIMSIYLDGILQNRGADSNNYIKSQIAIGSNGFNGNIDELRVSKVARWSNNFTPPETPYTSSSDLGTVLDSATILLVGGGGGGGSGASYSYEGGGGGGGGFLEATMDIHEGSHLVVVGQGGSPNRAGKFSAFDLTKVFGGGYGGGPSGASGGSGGSGGGGRATASGGQVIISGEGYPGGGGSNPSGGGGGAGGAGASGGILPNGAPGGLGKSSILSGEEVYYAAGGGGAATTNGVGGVGGSLIGGSGANWGGVGGSGVANSGSGGGGGSSNGSTQGGSGGSGLCIIRYKKGRIKGSGGTKIIDGDYIIHIFLETGTFIAESDVSYALEGTVVFGPYLLPNFEQDPLGSSIFWDSDTSSLTNVIVKVAISDGIPLDTDFLVVENGDTIPGLTIASSLKSMYIKAILTTEDSSVSPRLKNLNYSFARIPTKSKITIGLTKKERLKNPSGEILVKYLKTLGNLLGSFGTQVNSFAKTFTPAIQDPVFNPNEITNISAIVTQNVEMKHVEYVSVTEGSENILVSLSQNNTLYNVNEIPT